MGRQINFYADEKTERHFLEYCTSFCSLYTIINNKVTLITSIPKKDCGFFLYLYTEQFGDLFLKTYNNNERIDTIKSSVIEFSCTRVDHGKKSITDGRIWIESGYYNECGEYINKSKEFINLYNKLARWIKKNIPCRVMVFTPPNFDRKQPNDIDL